MTTDELDALCDGLKDALDQREKENREEFNGRFATLDETIRAQAEEIRVLRAERVQDRMLLVAIENQGKENAKSADANRRHVHNLDEQLGALKRAR